MKLVVHFLGEKNKRLGRDENLLPNLGINDISNEEEIRHEIEDYLSKHNDIKILTPTDTDVIIDSKNVKTVEISEGYFGGKSFDIEVTWY